MEHLPQTVRCGTLTEHLIRGDEPMTTPSKVIRRVTLAVVMSCAVLTGTGAEPAGAASSCQVSSTVLNLQKVAIIGTAVGKCDWGTLDPVVSLMTVQTQLEVDKCFLSGYLGELLCFQLAYGPPGAMVTGWPFNETLVGAYVAMPCIEDRIRNKATGDWLVILDLNKLGEVPVLGNATKYTSWNRFDCVVDQNIV